MEPDPYERDTLGPMSACDEELRASLDQYRTLLHSIDDGFCTFDMIFDDSGHPVDYRFVEYNPAFGRRRVPMGRLHHQAGFVRGAHVG